MVTDDIRWLSDKMIRVGIGEKLKEWRLEMNYSQSEVAGLTMLSLTTYVNFERGKGGSLANLVRILRVLNRLDALGEFFKKAPMSPLLAQKIEQGMKIRKRASKAVPAL